MKEGGYCGRDGMPHCLLPYSWVVYSLVFFVRLAVNGDVFLLRFRAVNLYGDHRQSMLQLIKNIATDSNVRHFKEATN